MKSAAAAVRAAVLLLLLSCEVLVGSVGHARQTVGVSCLKYLCDYTVWWTSKK
jgi:hypothetical protein